MKLTLKRTAISLALAGSFTLTGCNFIGDGDPVFVDPPVAEKFEVDGVAIKGELLNAIVRAFKVTEGANGEAVLTAITPDEGENVRTSTTDGTYTVTFSSGQVVAGDRIIIEIEADDDTEMNCDATDCGTLNSNGKVAVSGLKLSTVADISTSTASVSAPVNALTSIATEAVKKSAKADKAAISKAVYDLIGLSDAEQTDAGDVFSAKLAEATSNKIDGASGSTAAQTAVFKKLSALNSSLSKPETGKSVTESITSFVSTVAAAATSTGTVVEKQQAVAAATAKVKAAVAEVKKIVQDNLGGDDTIKTDFEEPKIENPDGTVITGTGTGTGSGSSNG